MALVGKVGCILKREESLKAVVAILSVLLTSLIIANVSAAWARSSDNASGLKSHVEAEGHIGTLARLKNVEKSISRLETSWEKAESRLDKKMEVIQQILLDRLPPAKNGKE